MVASLCKTKSIGQRHKRAVLRRGARSSAAAYCEGGAQLAHEEAAQPSQVAAQVRQQFGAVDPRGRFRRGGRGGARVTLGGARHVAARHHVSRHRRRRLQTTRLSEHEDHVNSENHLHGTCHVYLRSIL